MLPPTDSATSSSESKLDEYNRKLAEQSAVLAQNQQETLLTALQEASKPAEAADQQPGGDLESLLQQQQRASRSGPKKLTATLHAKLKSHVEPAQPDTFSSRRTESGPSLQSTSIRIPLEDRKS